MRIHILGICGTFMSGIALLAKELGHEVSGCDAKIEPPISTQLLERRIEVEQGYDQPLPSKTDLVIVGNVIKRGNPQLENILNHNIPFISGPQWLYEQVLRNRKVIAVSGTHGKTTTTSLLAWLLDYSGFHPGFLIGGIPENFGFSARLGKDPFFVIEADEYDTAFCDKRSKFIHYHPQTLILNNLEYDHADIFPNLQAIQQQFRALIRTIPSKGLIISNAEDTNVEEVLQSDCFTPVTSFGAKKGEWQYDFSKADGSRFTIRRKEETIAEINWNLCGFHNVENGLAAFIAAIHHESDMSCVIEAFSKFKNVKRRMEVKSRANNIFIYDDFAHHPTAIAKTLEGLRSRVGKSARIIVVIEFGSYSMRTGFHKENLPHAFHHADIVLCKNTAQDWGLAEILGMLKQSTGLFNDVESLVANLAPQLQATDHVIIMSNADFDGIHKKLIQAIEKA